MTDKRSLPVGSYGFGDLEVGDRIRSPSTVVTSEMVDWFAELTGDRFEIHMCETAAARHGFSGRVAHGLLILSLVDGLKNQADVRLRAQASLGWNWRFRRPVLVGDTINSEFEILEKRQTKDPARGILKLGFEVINQHGNLVQDGYNLLMAYT